MMHICKDIDALEGGGVNRVLKLFRPNSKLGEFSNLSLIKSLWFRDTLRRD